MANLAEKLQQVRQNPSQSSGVSSLTDKLKIVRDRVTTPRDAFNLEQFKPKKEVTTPFNVGKVSLSEKLNKMREKDNKVISKAEESAQMSFAPAAREAILRDKAAEPNAIMKTLDFVNPLNKTKVRPALAKEEQEIYGGKLIGGVADISSRIVEDLFVNGLKTYATIKRGGGAESESVKLPFDVSFQTGFDSEVTTTNELKDYTTNALARIKKFDEERPDKRNLNLIQGFTEEILFPVLDAVDIVGIGEIGVRGLRQLATDKASRQALNTLGVDFFGDVSEGGIEKSIKNKSDKIFKNLEKGRITEKEAVEQLNDMGEAIDILGKNERTRFGNLGEKAYNFGEALTRERTLKESLEQVRNMPAGLSVKSQNTAETISDIAENSLKNSDTGLRQSALDALRKNTDDVKNGTVRLREIEDGRIVIEDGRHRLEVARETGILPKFEDVTAEYTGEASQKIQDLIRGSERFQDDVRARFADDFIPQGFDSNVGEIKQNVRGYISQLEENFELEGLDFEIKDIEITGSRSKNVGTDKSDLDVIVEFEGAAREDDMFNALNRDKLKIDGIEVDINPIKADRSGTIDEYIKANEIAEGKYAPTQEPKQRKKTIPIRGADGKFQGSISLSDEIEQAPEGFKKLDDKRMIASDVAEELNRGNVVKNLVAVHNFSPARLDEIQRAGGLPNPSIAIYRAGDEYESFGSISLVGNAKMIDPQASDARVFAGDIYSPRVDVVDYPNFKGIFDKQFEQLRKDLDAADIYYQDWGDLSGLSRERVVRKLQELDGVDSQEANRIADEIWGEPRVLLKKDEPTGELASLIAEEPSVKEIFDRSEDFDDFRLVLENEIDLYPTLERRIEESGFEDMYDYIASMVDDFAENLDATAENLAKKSRKTNAARGVDIRGGEKGFGAAAPNRVFAFDELKSIDEIKEQASRSLKSPSKEAVDELAENFDKIESKLMDDIGEVLNLKGSKDFGLETGENMDAFIQDVIRKQDISEAAKLYLGVDRVSTTQAEDIKRLVDDAYENVPAGYFEAKRLDAVTLDEFSGAVIPDDPDDVDPLLDKFRVGTAAELEEKLKSMGIKKVLRYKDEADRADKIKNGFKDHMFAVTPVPIVEEDEEGNLKLDVTKTALASAGVGLGVKKAGGTGKPKKRSVSKARKTFNSAKEVIENSFKVNKRVSGIEPNGVKTAATKLDGVKEIPNTPAKSSRYSMKNTKAPIEIPDETRQGYLQRKFIDKFNRLEFIQKKITDAKGMPISDDLNAYLQQEMFHGRAAERLDKFEKSIITTKGQKGEKALLQRMADDGIDIDEMGEYLHAKHAKARNKRVAEINPDIPDGGSGLTNAQAEKILKKYDDAGKTEKLEAYRKEVKEKIVDARLKILEEEHLLKPDSVENIARAFEDDTYIPLKLKEKPDIRLRGGKGFDTRGKDIKKLKGSTKAERSNPLIQAIVDYEDTVIKAEKNKVGRTIKKLIEDNPNIKNSQGENIWEIKAQQYAPQYNKFGEVEYVKPVGFKLADNVMEVRDQGKIYHVTFNDPALASAMKNLGSERGIKFLHQINNYLRAVTTFYNPEFMITNFERDIQTALINTAGERGSKAAKDVTRDVGKALSGIWNNVRGGDSKIKKGVDWSKEYEELKEVGGRVGWFDYATVAEKQAKIQSRINRASGKSKMDKAAATWDAVAEWVSDVNESVESGVRLSAYVNAKKAGMTKEQAASLAKNLTVNFNKKGEWGTAINSLYLFANAGIQGSVRILKALRHKRTQRIVAGIAAFSYGVNYMNDQINGESYDKLSDFEKNTNLIFMLPSGADAPDIDAAIGSVETVEGTDEKYIKIKLPYGYNIFKVLGDIAYDTTMKKETTGDNLKRMVFAMDESFNPLSSGSAAQLVSPTVSDPIVQMYENKNFFGSPIKPDQDPYGAKKKQSDLYFSSVRQPTKAVTDWLNDVTGGNDVEAGIVDLSPENVDHVIDFLGGGISKFIANTIDSGIALSQGDLPEVNKTPFVRKFVGEVYSEVERSLFYDLVNKAETNLLSDRELEELKDYGRQALKEGSIDKEAATRAVTNLKTNQARIHAGRVLDDMENTTDPAERREIFNTYIESNELDNSRDTIIKEFKDLVANRGEEADEASKDKGFLQTLIDGGRGLFIDPANVWKAVTSEEKIGRVKGNLVELQRFYGIEFTEEGGSQEKKREMMESQGLSWDQAGDYKLEHITPVKAGGDTSDENLRIVTNEEHDAYTPVDIAAAAAVQTKNMTRKEVTELMKRLKIDKTISAEEAYEEIRSKGQ